MKDIYEARILIVDDEADLCKMVKDILQQEGFSRLFSASGCKKALETINIHLPDMVILDVMLQDGDGFELIREIRAVSPVPVLFLSARDEDDNRLLGLGLGADDYLTKPFLPRELVLRLKAILTRTYFPATTRQEKKPVFFLGETKIDLNSGTVKMAGNEEKLTAKEYILLEKLHENLGRIVTGDNLCLAVWGDHLYSYENTLMVHIRRLREKIEPEPSNPKYLLTVRGLGYRLVEG